MITFCSSPVKLIRKLENGEIQCIILQTNQILSRPANEFEDNSGGIELDCELILLELFKEEYEDWIKREG